MKKHIQRLEQRKLMQERVFVKADLELKESILSENSSEFMQRVYETAGKDRPPAEEGTEKSKPQSSWDGYGEGAATKAKKLYREISKRTHPDKDPSGHYTDIFAGAAIAYENCNLFDLYEYCDLLNIEYLMDEVEVTAVKEEIAEKRQRAKVIESSFAYLWSIHESEKMREIIVKQFIKAVGGKL